MKPTPLTAAALVTVVIGATSHPAQAASSKPSFDCRKAKQADEIAICKSDELAALDVATTNFFENAKSRNREEGLRIARTFLAQRAVCGANAVCIKNAQSAALGSFASV